MGQIIEGGLYVAVMLTAIITLIMLAPPLTPLQALCIIALVIAGVLLGRWSV